MIPAGLYAQINYQNDIKPILKEHCTICHSRGKIGPMALDSYDNVAAFANMIEYVTSENLMPPWRADQNYSQLEISKFLSDKEKNIIKEWIINGRIENPEKNIDHLIIAADEDSLSIKKDTISDRIVTEKNDLITSTFIVDSPYEHEGDYGMHQRVFVIPSHFDKDVYVKKIEFVPGDSTIVLGCTVSIDTSDQAERYDQMDPKSGYANISSVGFVPYALAWYHWSPDLIADTLERYKLLPAGSNLLLHITYGPCATNTIDQSKIILTYTESQHDDALMISEVLTDKKLTSSSFVIPKNQQQVFHAEYEFEQDATLYSIMPFGQIVCSEWEIFIMHQNNTITPLLKIEDWQMKWKRKYHFTQAIAVDAGDKIIAKATYNNTEENINITIFPTKPVYYGEALDEELFMVAFDFTTNTTQL